MCLTVPQIPKPVLQLSAFKHLPLSLLLTKHNRHIRIYFLCLFLGTKISYVRVCPTSWNSFSHNSEKINVTAPLNMTETKPHDFYMSTYWNVQIKKRYAPYSRDKFWRSFHNTGNLITGCGSSSRVLWQNPTSCCSDFESEDWSVAHGWCTITQLLSKRGPPCFPVTMWPSFSALST
jgi:hypothetical protein